MATEFKKIIYIKKKNIDLSAYKASPAAMKAIESVGIEDNLVLRLKINSPVFIEAAEPLTKEGIDRIVKV